MKKTIPIVLVLLLGMVSIGLTAEDTWTRKTDMPTARGYLETAVVNGRIYAIGGAYGSTSGSSAVEEYDPSTDTWTRKANMPQARSGFSTSVMDGKIYVIGGGASPYGALRSSIYTYDPEIDTWTRKAEMPTPRAGLSANIVDGKIYVIGGSSGNLSTGSKTVELYDPDENNWTRKADMPTARFDHRASVVDGKIYVIGGTTGSPSWAGVSIVEVYDPANDSWTRKANMPTPRWGFAISEVDGKIYAIGGASAPSWFSTVEQYNPATNVWTTKTSMSIRRREFSASSVDGKIYAIGGAAGNQGATYALATVEEYDTGIGPHSPDFNGDGIVDSIDMCILVEHWQTDYPTCDIAPPPFGDGIVDVQDLVLLAEHLFEEIYPKELIAYWKLDETEGDIAFNNISDNHGLLSGSPAWQPETGKVAGALELDGIDDYIDAGFVLNPADGPFSVFAWIKSAVPKKMIISQSNGDGAGDTWLYMDEYGNLMTGLRSPAVGRFVPQPLESETIITDDQWHHIGFVWDGAYRILYVDAAEAARDPDVQNPLKSADGGMIIGAGNNLGAGTLCSGLIDDVRIYDVALTADEITALAQ
jgi:N-acetylneuraminic acid mutarotase